MNDRRPVWPWIIAAIIGLPVMYVVSFGPACWICERMDRGTNWVSATYRPVIWLGNRASFGTSVMTCYAQLGARPQATPDFRHDKLTWWEFLTSGSISWSVTSIHCSVGDPEDESTDESDTDEGRPDPKAIDGLSEEDASPPSADVDS